MSDQTIKSDAGKPKLTLTPRQIIRDITEVREYGNQKYPEGGPDNWKRVEPERYRDAAFRHFLAYLDDPDSVDPESGIKHLKHLACNIAFLCEMENANPTSDRYRCDDITFCTADCETDCFRKPKYIWDLNIPHSYADFRNNCMAFEMRGERDD